MANQTDAVNILLLVQIFCCVWVYSNVLQGNYIKPNTFEHFNINEYFEFKTFYTQRALLRIQLIFTTHSLKNKFGLHE